jgi:hypothetical protein
MALTRFFSGVDDMARTVSAWDAIRREDVSYLEDWVQSAYDNSADNEQESAIGGEGDVLVRARRHLRDRINSKLSTYTSPALFLGSELRRFSIHLSPSGLSGCLWLQFALAVEGDKSYQQCGECRTWFEVGGNRTARSDKKFCTPTCKANHHRKAKEEIRRLHRDGVSAADIADRTGKDLSKIMEWIRS